MEAPRYHGLLSIYHFEPAFSALNGRWISYSEFYTDGYWQNHPRENMGLYSKNFGMVSDWLAILSNLIC